jgi:hypothetical protein
MSGGFEAADQAFEQSQSASPDSTTSSAPEMGSGSDRSTGAPAITSQQQDAQTQAEQIMELEKHFGDKKFRFNGQEMTVKELRAAYMRQQDYTTKTQTLAEERKYYENLYWDLQKVKENPQLVQEFIKTYPEKFHNYLDSVLKNTQGQQTVDSRAQSPQYDVQTLSRLERLEKSYHAQELEKNELAIQQVMTSMAKKYPDAHDRFVLPVAYELAEKKGEQLTEQEWEDIYKAADQEMKSIIKGKISENQKKQSEANRKAQDVSSGGGTVGQAPKKFKTIQEVGEYAQRSLSNRG